MVKNTIGRATIHLVFPDRAIEQEKKMLPIAYDEAIKMKSQREGLSTIDTASAAVNASMNDGGISCLHVRILPIFIATSGLK